MFWKDKPEGGTLTGPARCESSRLVLRHIIRFHFLLSFDRPLFLQCYLGYPVNWAQAIKLSRNKTSVFIWGSVRMLLEGDQTLKRAPLPLHCLMDVKQVTQMRQFMI